MWNEVRASYSENGIGGNARPHPVPTAIELRRNGFFPILIVILLLISKNLSRASLRLGLRLRACQCGPSAGLNSMTQHPVTRPFRKREGARRPREGSLLV